MLMRGCVPTKGESMTQEMKQHFIVLSQIILVIGMALIGAQETPAALQGVIQPLEAEAVDVTRIGAQVATNHKDFTGTGFVDFTGEGSIEWTFNVARAGLYQLEFRYALRSGDRPLNIVGTNGISIKPNVSFPATGSFDVWKTVSVFAQFDAGPNSVRAVTTGTSGANIDHLVVSLTPPDLNRFLTFPVHSSHKDFVGSDDNAAAYYAVIDPSNQRDTFDKFKAVNGMSDPQNNQEARGIHRATYLNAGDLGFGRDMYVRVTKTGDGKVISAASYVQNYLSVADAVDGQNLLATVAMEYGPSADNPSGPRFTKFYVYDKNGQRLKKIDLDGRGDKFVPGLCNVCHGGKPKAGGFHGSLAVYENKGDTGAKWIPWDLDTYEYDARKTRAQQEDQFKKLNVDLLDIFNDRPKGTSVSSGAAIAIKGWYGGEGLPNPTFNGNFVPPGWANTTDGNKSDLYLKVVAPTCRACHLQRGTYHNSGHVVFQGQSLQQSLEFNSYDDFKGYKKQIEPLVYDMGVMPVAKRTYENFWRSDAPLILDDELFGGQVYQNPADLNPNARVAPVFGSLRRPGRPIPNIAGIRATFGLKDQAPIGHFCFQGPIFTMADAVEGQRVRLNGRSSLFADTFNWSYVDPQVGCTPASGPPLSGDKTSFASFVLDPSRVSDIKKPQAKPYFLKLTVGNEFSSGGGGFNEIIVGQLFTDSSLKPLVFADNNANTKDIYELIKTNFALSGASGASGPLSCVHCHSNGILGRASGVFDMWDVKLPGGQDSELWKLVAYQRIMSRVDCRDPENSLILKKPSGHHHNGGTVQGFGMGSGFNHLGSGDDSNRDAILRWIMEGAPFAGNGKPSDLGCPNQTLTFIPGLQLPIKPLGLRNGNQR